MEEYQGEKLLIACKTEVKGGVVAALSKFIAVT
jgi:hypothetical protein